MHHENMMVEYIFILFFVLLISYPFLLANTREGMEDPKTVYMSQNDYNKLDNQTTAIQSQITDLSNNVFKLRNKVVAIYGKQSLNDSVDESKKNYTSPTSKGESVNSVVSNATSQASKSGQTNASNSAAANQKGSNYNF